MSAAQSRSAARAPRVSTVLVLSVAVAVSLVPSVLPRPAVLQGVFTGILLGLGLLVDALSVRVAPHRTPRAPSPRAWWGLALSAGAVLAVTVWAHGAQTRIRAGMGMEAPTAGYWLTAAGVGLLVCLVPVALVRLCGATLALVRTGRGRVVVAVAGLLVLATAAQGASGGQVLGASSGDTEWVDTEPLGAGVRVFVGLDEAATAADRADLAVERLEEAGGLERGSVLVALPTGSGWVNPEAVAGLESATGGDLATVAVQSGTAPSWWELLLRREEHEAAAEAVVEAVTDRVAELDPSRRPRVYLLGESLGALVGRDLLTETTAPGQEVCGAVWAGVPGGVTAASPAELVHGNPDDPVVLWRPELLVRRPDGWPAPVWLPGVSYLAAAVDQVAALAPPPGHGHVYGPEQRWALPTSCRV